MSVAIQTVVYAALNTWPFFPPPPSGLVQNFRAGIIIYSGSLCDCRTLLSREPEIHQRYTNMTERLGYQPFQLAALLQNSSGATPTIDTQYAQCAAAQNAFMMSLQSYVAKAKEEIKTRKEVHLQKQAEEEERKKEYEREIEECAAKEVKMIEQVKQEKREVAEIEANVAELDRRLTNTSESSKRKDEEIEELRKKVILRRGVLARDREILSVQANRTAREAKALQDALGWTIEGIQKDLLLFRFTHIDSTDPAREFSVVLDISNRTYRATSSTPLLGTLPTLLEELNQTRQLYVFVRQLRDAFCVMIEEERRYKT